MKKYTLKYSLVCSFSGEHPELSEYWPCETTLADVIREWPGDAVEPTDPFDSEYDYLAREGSIPSEILERLDSCETETRFQICRKLKERYPTEAFWACISDIQMSGIFDRETLFGFLDSIGASFEDCETQGTLGGPLGGIVPDFSFNVESQALISCIRVTPILCDETGEPCRAPNEREWNQIRDLFRNYDCFDLARSGRAVAA